MGEDVIVNIVVSVFRKQGFTVATEVANFNRSADVAAIDSSGRVIVVECKISNMSQAMNQLRTHKHSADRLYIATPHRKMRDKTVSAIKERGLGLFCIDEKGEVTLEFDDSGNNKPWEPARDRLRQRILEGS